MCVKGKERITIARIQAVTPVPQDVTMGWSKEIPAKVKAIKVRLNLDKFTVCVSI